MNNTLKITIELYGRLKSELGKSPSEVEFASPKTAPTLERIYLNLCEKNQVSPNTSIIKPILNDTFAQWDDTVENGDVVGFFPPASGG